MMETQELRYRDELNANEIFFLSYGSFLTLWNMFELRMEFLIWHIRSEVCNEKIYPLENCLQVNPLKTDRRMNNLRELLKKAKQDDVLNALEEVCAIAERDDWIHGHIIRRKGSNPEKLARFKVVYNKEQKNMRAECKFFDDFKSPFGEFTDTLQKFYSTAEKAFNLQSDAHDDYLTKVLDEQGKREASSPPKSPSFF